MPPLSAPESSRVASTLASQRELVRDELSAAWQFCVSRVEEQLHTGWNQRIERIVEERFAELAERLAQDLAPAPEPDALTLRAQRFARVRAAKMRLFHSDAVVAGRAVRNLYAALREEIDSAREAYRLECLSAAPAIPDYLHIELLRTLANNDVAVLGDDYPGPLV
jgi:hypothetical protein